MTGYDKNNPDNIACMSLWKFQGKVFNECTDYFTEPKRPWCALATDAHFNMLNGSWA